MNEEYDVPCEKQHMRNPRISCLEHDIWKTGEIIIYGTADGFVTVVEWEIYQEVSDRGILSLKERELKFGYGEIHATR